MSNHPHDAFLPEERNFQPSHAPVEMEPGQKQYNTEMEEGRYCYITCGLATGVISPI